MIRQRLLQVLRSPHVSEKATVVCDADNQYVFKVAKDATKLEIKQAVEGLFKVSVLNVNLLNVKGKQKRFGRFTGRRKDWKKAYVKVAEGQKIEFLDAVQPN
jgi:large subunit ribosomal protein L23